MVAIVVTDEGLIPFHVLPTSLSIQWVKEPSKFSLKDIDAILQSLLLIYTSVKVSTEGSRDHSLALCKSNFLFTRCSFYLRGLLLTLSILSELWLFWLKPPHQTD